MATHNTPRKADRVFGTRTGYQKGCVENVYPELHLGCCVVVYADKPQPSQSLSVGPLQLFH